MKKILSNRFKKFDSSLQWLSQLCSMSMSKKYFFKYLSINMISMIFHWEVSIVLNNVYFISFEKQVLKTQKWLTDFMGGFEINKQMLNFISLEMVRGIPFAGIWCPRSTVPASSGSSVRVCPLLHPRLKQCLQSEVRQRGIFIYNNIVEIQLRNLNS